MRLTSTPVAFCRVPATVPSGLRYGPPPSGSAAAAPAPAAAARAGPSRAPRRAGRRSEPRDGPLAAGTETVSGTPRTERPYSSSRQPRSTLPVVAPISPSRSRLAGGGGPSARRCLCVGGERAPQRVRPSCSARRGAPSASILHDGARCAGSACADVREEVVLDLEVEPAQEPGQDGVAGAEVDGGLDLVDRPDRRCAARVPTGDGKDVSSTQCASWKLTAIIRL